MASLDWMRPERFSRLTRPTLAGHRGLGVSKYRQTEYENVDSKSYNTTEQGHEGLSASDCS